MSLHFFYLGASDNDFEQKQGKGGETEEPYMRLHRYGTSYFGNNKFRYRFIVAMKNLSKKQIHIIEKNWLGSFEEIESDSEDEGDLNQASTIEGIKYDSLQQVKDNFTKTIESLNVKDSLYKFYETNDAIIELLRVYRSTHYKIHKEAKSLCGKLLRDYQNEDIHSTVYAFIHEKVKRGYWDIECGLGKSIMAIELILKLQFRQNLFVVPRNTLLYQFIDDLRECNIKDNQIFICNGMKNPEEYSNIKKVKLYSDLPKETWYICLTTYDSLVKLDGGKVDLTVFDEAHHCVPSVKKEDLSGNLFGLSDNNIDSKLRLFLTGTVKDVNVVENDTTTYKGMSKQPDLYGECLAKRNYSFGLKNGYLSQFDVVCIKTTQEFIRASILEIKKAFKLPECTFQEFLTELKKWEQGRSRAMNEHIERIDEDDNISSDTVLWYGIVSQLLIETIFKYNSKRIVTYHSTIRRAKLFNDVFKKIWEMKHINKSLYIDSVSSNNSEIINATIKKRYKQKENSDEIRILSNIRTLIEGFNDPSIDTTVFADNKWSSIESKQIIGRGNRKDPNNPFKIHKVIIPFLAYETFIDETTYLIKTTNDYNTVRYTIKNIIHSDDPSLTMTHTVWVPKIKENRDEDDDDKFESDPTERVYISEESFELHDSNILGSCSTQELAEKSFQNARIWMHALAKKLEWHKFTNENKLNTAWDTYRKTHVLPKDIPCNPSKIYKMVGWISMRDYTGVMTTRSEWQDIKEGELVELFRTKIIDPYDCTLKTLRELIEKVSTRKLPVDHKKKWNTTIYDLARLALPSVKNNWTGKYAESIYTILQKEGIADTLDFERFWPELHLKYPIIPGMPSDVWGETFWADYDP